MNKYTTYYYLLFVLLIMGTFASMAQNDYGITILGLVSFSFCLLFTIQLIYFISKQGTKKHTVAVIEMISLVLLSGILSLRVFYIRFAFVEELFLIAGLLLIVAYGTKLFTLYKATESQSKLMARLIVLYHGSIIFYVVSMITVAFIPKLSEPTGGIGFVMIVLFTLLSFSKREILIGSEKLSPFQFVQRFKDRSLVLITLFLLFTLYMGLTKFRILPKMYSNEFPQAYFDLVNSAETGKDQKSNGKFKHEDFKEMYDQFVDRNLDSK